MRRLILIAALLLASPAGAQGGKLRVIKPPTAAGAGLKGPAETPVPEAPPELDFSVQGRSTGLPAGLAFTRPLASTAGGSAGSRTASQCRTACAQSRYFCLAEAEEATCSPPWARCVAGCS